MHKWKIHKKLNIRHRGSILEVIIRPFLFLIALNLSALVYAETEATNSILLYPVDYSVKSSDNLSNILHENGFGHEESPLKLYSKNSVFDLVRILNPSIRSIDNLEKGSEIRILSTKSRQGVSEKSASKGWLKIFNISSKVKEPLQFEFIKINEVSSLSKILYKRGVGTPGSIHKLFGKNGWIEKVKILNPKITNWNSLSIGQPLLLVYPIKVLMPTDQNSEISEKKSPLETSNTQIEPKNDALEVPSPKNATEILSKPENARVDDILKLPPSDLEAIPPKIIAEKLTTNAIENLSEQDVSKVPQEVKVKKAWEYSAADIQKPGMDKFFENLKLTAPGALIGVRYGISLTPAKSNPLASKIRAVGVMTELREGPVKGLRFLYDLIPKVSTYANEDNKYLQSQKILLGWGLQFDSSYFINQFHLVPKIGSYSIKLREAVASNDLDQEVVSDFEVNNAMSYGLEVDAEIAKYFYIVRSWAAADFSIETKRGASSIRAGLDLFLKGRGFSITNHDFSSSLLIFAALESIALTGRNDDYGDYSIELAYPMVGLGTNVTW